MRSKFKNTQAGELEKMVAVDELKSRGFEVGFDKNGDIHGIKRAIKSVNDMFYNPVHYEKVRREDEILILRKQDNKIVDVARG
ncbi:hypothetical protein [Campylobacter sputorum]|uniref:hypothetical protein n=1 Tax=Campylobacter sputorum TaxID=206 RepID=UPI00053BF9ED|nr:hypothetical protein [Campylobacter sputorum]